MSTETQTGTATDSATGVAWWLGGVAGGLLGGLAMGVLMQLQLRNALANAIPQLYGLGPDALAVGWAIHLVHSAILGLVFVAAVEFTALDDLLDDNLKNGVAGLVYGVLLWALLAAIVMPIWLGAVTSMEPPVPNLEGPVTERIVGHAVYGVVLGIAYSVLSDL